MDLIRDGFDYFYDLIKHPLFYLTKENAEIAHDLFVLFSRGLYFTRLEKLILDNKENYVELPFEISNAAGLNKNAKIPPQIIEVLGFDRNVIGTFTGEPWKGEKRPRIKRYPSYDSLINWIAWDNEGAEIISKRIKLYGDCKIPITISIGPTPKSFLSLEERFSDIEKTINLSKNILSVDRFEYCPSCPNLKISREENLELLGEFTMFIRGKINPSQKLYVKISPDLNEKEVDRTILSTFDYVAGYVTTNTTTQHDYGVGSGSGEILYPLSLNMQKKFYERLEGTGKKIIACGGINSIERMEERRRYGTDGFQFFTPFVNNQKLLRQIKNHNWD